MEELERLLCVAYFLKESLHWTRETETVKGFLTRVHQLGYTEITREDLLRVTEMFERFRKGTDQKITQK